MKDTEKIIAPNGTGSSGFNLKSISDRILSSVEDRVHKYDNYQYSSFQYNILLLQRRYQDDPERQYASLLLAALLEHCLKSDFYIRNVYTHGDVYSESAAIWEINERQDDRFLSDLGRYVAQSSPESDLPKENWGIYFYTEYLMTELFCQQGNALLDDESAFHEWFPEETFSRDLPTEKRSELLKEFDMDCGGLFPLIDEDSCEIHSWMPLINTPQYCFAFLYIPKDIIGDFRPHIPGYLHEICHYLPPISRGKRNQVSLRLLACSITNEWRNELFRKLDEAGFAREVNEKLCGSYITAAEELIRRGIVQLAGGEFILQKDSLTLCNYTICSLLDCPDDGFEKGIYGIEPELSEVAPEDRETVHSAVSELLKKPKYNSRMGDFQRKHAVRFASLCNYLLRELRSDIHMTVMLEIPLTEYIELMAREPRFASEDVSVIGDYLIFRFGLITRFLWQLETHSADPFCFCECQTKDELEEWKKACFEALDGLEKAYPAGDRVRNHILNLKEYLKKFMDMSIETQEGYYSLPYRSLLEHELAGEINAWYRRSVQMKGCRSVEHLRKLYSGEVSSEMPIYEDMTGFSLGEMERWNVSWPFAPDDPQISSAAESR